MFSKNECFARLFAVVAMIVCCVCIFISCDNQEEACEHEWADATCESAKRCVKCNVTEGDPLGHSLSAATCVDAEKCMICRIEFGEALGHKGGEADCETAAECSVCKEPYGDPLGHNWKNATCEEPKTCDRCGTKEGEPLRHNYVYTNKATGEHEGVCANDPSHIKTENCYGGKANCLAKAVCDACKTEYGNIGDHTWIEATCTSKAYCDVCKEEDGEPLGHDYDYSTGECSECGDKVSIVLYTSNSDIIIESGSQAVIFYAEIKIDSSVSSVKLYDSLGVFRATMYDNGDYQSCYDEFSNDGVYTCRIYINTSSENNLSFTVVINDNEEAKSNNLAINWVEKMNDTQISNMQTVDSQLSNVVDSDSFENLSDEEKKEIVSEKIETLKQNSLIVTNSVVFDEGTSTFTFVYESGALGAIALKEWINSSEQEYPDLDNSQFNNSTAADAIILWSFDQLWDVDAIRSPYYNELVESWNSRGLNTTLDKDVTVDDYKNLSSYEVIVLSAHGAYYKYRVGNSRTRTIPGIILSEEVSREKDALYANDLSMHRIAKVTLIGGTKYVILPAFWEYYYGGGKLDGSFIVSESCEFFGDARQEDKIMANAMLGAAAESVVGFRNSAILTYSRDFMSAFVLGLIEGKTSEEAFEFAKQTSGENDYFIGRELLGATAYPIFVGNDVQLIISDLENGSFEDPINLTGWTTEGDVRVLNKLGELDGTDGNKMAILTTGVGSGTSNYVGATEGSVLKQSFLVGSGNTVLSFDYNVVSEEPMEFVGSRYDDKMYVEFIDANGNAQTICAESVNTSTWYSVSGINFEGGDTSAYHTKWKTVTFDVSAYVGQMVTVKFVVYDVGDSAYDTAALIDNVVLK